MAGVLVVKIEKLLKRLQLCEVDTLAPLSPSLQKITSDFCHLASQIEYSQIEYGQPLAGSSNQFGLAPSQAPVSYSTPNRDGAAHILEMADHRSSRQTDGQYVHGGHLEAIQENKQNQFDGQIQALLKAVDKITDRVSNALSALEQSDVFFLSQDQRTAHLQPLACLQKPKASPLSDLDRILLVFACRSFAAEYETFESSSGWTSKYHQLLEPLLRGEEPHVKRIPSHIQNFASAFRVLDRENLAIALNFGTKLQVLETLIGDDSIAKGWIFLLGFEYHGISRMSYGALTQLKAHIVYGFEHERARNFARERCSWFAASETYYNYLYSSQAFRNASDGSGFPQGKHAVHAPQSDETHRHFPKTTFAASSSLPVQGASSSRQPPDSEAQRSTTNNDSTYMNGASEEYVDSFNQPCRRGSNTSCKDANMRHWMT